MGSQNIFSDFALLLLLLPTWNEGSFYFQLPPGETVGLPCSPCWESPGIILSHVLLLRKLIPLSFISSVAGLAVRPRRQKGGENREDNINWRKNFAIKKECQKFSISREKDVSFSEVFFSFVSCSDWPSKRMTAGHDLHQWARRVCAGV